MSVLFKNSEYLRYLHKPGLIMRHDKEAFAGEAIKAAATGKLIGDYVRLLIFSYYARLLPWSLKRIKSEMDPFTGSFISHLPLTVVYLRFALKAISMLENENESSVEFVLQGISRLGPLVKDLLENNNHFLEKYIMEKEAWDFYYDLINIAEDKLNQNDPFMLEIKTTAEKIINKCLL